MPSWHHLAWQNIACKSISALGKLLHIWNLPKQFSTFCKHSHPHHQHANTVVLSQAQHLPSALLPSFSFANYCMHEHFIPAPSRLSPHHVGTAQGSLTRCQHANIMILFQGTASAKCQAGTILHYRILHAWAFPHMIHCGPFGTLPSLFLTFCRHSHTISMLILWYSSKAQHLQGALVAPYNMT